MKELNFGRELALAFAAIQAGNLEKAADLGMLLIKYVSGLEARVNSARLLCDLNLSIEEIIAPIQNIDIVARAKK